MDLIDMMDTMDLVGTALRVVPEVWPIFRSPNGAIYGSPGQRPGNVDAAEIEACKGASTRRSIRPRERLRSGTSHTRMLGDSMLRSGKLELPRTCVPKLELGNERHLF